MCYRQGKFGMLEPSLYVHKMELKMNSARKPFADIGDLALYPNLVTS